jgi:hypothetical protein
LRVEGVAWSAHRIPTAVNIRFIDPGFKTSFVYSFFEEDETGRVSSTYGEQRSACGILVRKPEGTRLLGTPRRRWEDNIQMDLR